MNKVNEEFEEKLKDKLRATQPKKSKKKKKTASRK